MSNSENVEKDVSEERDVMKDIGVMFLCASAGYGIAQYQNTRRSTNQIVYQRVTDTKSLPQALADKAEAVIRAGGHAGIRKVGALLELIVQNATVDTEIFQQALDGTNNIAAGFEETKSAPKGAAGTSGYKKAKSDSYVSGAEYFDEETQTWRPCE